MHKEIFEKLQKFIMKNYMVEIDEVKWDESLIDQGIIDSIGLIEIVSFIEAQYKVKINESDITRANFGSVVLMSHYAESLVKKYAQTN